MFTWSFGIILLKISGEGGQYRTFLKKKKQNYSMIFGTVSGFLARLNLAMQYCRNRTILDLGVTISLC